MGGGDGVEGEEDEGEEKGEGGEARGEFLRHSGFSLRKVQGTSERATHRLRVLYLIMGR